MTIAVGLTKDSSVGSSDRDDDEEKPPINVSKIQATALLVSYWRFKESQRPGGLISDLPDGLILDSLLSPAQRRAFEESPILERGIDALALRTRFIDDWVLLGQDEQRKNVLARNAVVNLGAGMDTRPYRLSGLANRSTYIEIDSDVSLLEVKHSILQRGSTSLCADRLGPSAATAANTTSSVVTMKPFCTIVRAGADLSDAQSTLQSLRAAGLKLSEASTNGSDDANESVDWIAEGLFAYLDPSHHRPLLKLTHDASGPHSRMVLTVLDPIGEVNFRSLGFEIPYARLVPVQEIVRQAREVGWREARVVPFEELFQRYHRSPVTDLTGYVLLTLAKQ
jgi:O-methyltransferase involved in polyketide biosynthesis